jgi:uncharacterized membrane-anchored protein
MTKSLWLLLLLLVLLTGLTEMNREPIRKTAGKEIKQQATPAAPYNSENNLSHAR